MERLRPFYTWGMCLMELMLPRPELLITIKLATIQQNCAKEWTAIKRPLSNSIGTSANKAQGGDDRIRLILAKVLPPLLGGIFSSSFSKR